MSKSILAEKYLGWLPDHWERCQLGDLCLKILDGVHQTPTYVEEGIPFLRVTDLQNSLIDLSKVKRISKEEFEEITKNNKPEKGDILLSKNGTIGLSKVIDWDWDFATFVSLALLKLPKRNCKIRADFLCRLFESEVIWQQIRNYSKTGTVTNLHLEEIRKLWVPLPPKPEQDRIAAILGTWDEAIAKTQALIERKERRQIGIALKFFEKLIKEQHQVVLAKDIFEPISEKNAPDMPLLAVTQDQGVIPRDLLDRRVVMPEGNVDGYKVVRTGDFVISLRSFEGGLEYSNYEGLISPAYTVIRAVQPINHDFYRHYFKSRSFIGRLNPLIFGIRDGKQIPFRDFSAVKVPYPSMEIQESLADVLNEVDKELKATREYLDLLQNQKKGLMQKLLTGEWPVAAAQTPQLQEAAG